MTCSFALVLLAFSAAADQCDESQCPPQHVNVVFMGYDLPAPCGDISEAARAYGNVSSYGECCQICQGDPDCGAFTFTEQSGRCALKRAEAAQSPVNASGMVSGNLKEMLLKSDQHITPVRSTVHPPATEWMCDLCQHVYDAAKDGGGKAFEDLPDTWLCPVCGQPKGAYVQGPPCNPDKCPPQHVDIDFPGNDLEAPCGNVSGALRIYYHINQYEDCCTICQGVPECGAFTFSSADGLCALKKNGAAKTSVSTPGMISGNMDEAPDVRRIQHQVDVRWV